ncbi:MAG: T9SS type A sorting domain-containing protein [Bacteroidetes bacterium]|nr:T9SS type A sorting domain-containing protein [Bacteroidota bacterium]
MKKYLSLLLLLCSGFAHAQSNTTKGTEFWLAFMENLTLSMNGTPEFSLVISSESTTGGLIEFPATGFSIPFNVNAMQATEIYLPQSILYPQGDEAISNTGLKITSNDSINVYAYHHRLYFSDATMVLPVNELSSSCMITAAKDNHNANPSEMVVLATADSTTIAITPSVLTVSVRPPGVPFYVTLNKGQTFQLQAFDDLSGTVVAAVDSSKKIATFAGARQAFIGCGTGADSHVYDAGYPAMFGNSFVVVPLLNFGGDPVKILSSADSNLVFINNGPPIFLNRGEFLDTTLNVASFIVADKPISVSQFMKSYGCNPNQMGDPNMVVLTPIDLLKIRAIYKNIEGPQNATFVHNPNHYVNIVTKKSPANANVTLDGIAITGFQSVTANPQYSYVRLTVASGDHSIYSPDGFNAFTYDVGDYNATTFHLGYDFKDVPVGIEEHDNDVKSSIYPNPFTDQTAITLTGTTTFREAELLMFSADGKKILQKAFTGNTTTIQRNNIAAGLYFYVVVTENKVVSRGKVSVY